MEANIVAEHVIVREHPDGTSPVVARLEHGARVRLGQATFRRAWVQVTLPDGRVGHIRGEAATRTEPMSHAVVVGTPLKVRFVRDMGEPPAVTVPEAQIISTGALSAAQYVGWTEVALVDGTHGYVEGEPLAQRIAWSQLNQSNVTLHREPNSASPIVRTINSGSIIGIGPRHGHTEHPWLRAIQPDGADGFIPPRTQITRLDAALRLRRLLTFPGKCVSCAGAGEMRMANIHLLNRANDFIGDCFVPVCPKCVRGRFYFNLVSLFTLGSAATVGTALGGMNLVGAVAFVPFGFYTMNAAHKGATVRRYRRVAEREMEAKLTALGVSATELDARQEVELDEVWPDLEKWLVCPGCHQLHREQAPWCPECRYLFPWRFGPRP